MYRARTTCHSHDCAGIPIQTKDQIDIFKLKYLQPQQNLQLQPDQLEVSEAQELECLRSAYFPPSDARADKLLGKQYFLLGEALGLMPTKATRVQPFLTYKFKEAFSITGI